MTEISRVKASVIVLNWNGKKHLHVCLGSLRAQTFQDMEVILVDNGSTDGSVELVKQEFAWVKVLELGRNLGFCGGNNAGIRVSQGEYVALLNNDTEVTPQWIEALCQVLDENPNVGFCASKMMQFDNRHLIDNAGDSVTTACNTLERGRGYPDGPCFQSNGVIFSACAGASIYRRPLLEKVGLLDEDFFIVYEDVDLAFRAQLMGYNCRYVSDAIVYHKLGATRGKYPAWQVFQSQRNIEYIWLKNMPFYLMIKYAHHKLLYTFGSFVYFTKQGHGLTFIRSKLAVLRNLPRTLRKRKLIQHQRLRSVREVESLLETQWLRSKIHKFFSRSS